MPRRPSPRQAISWRAVSLSFRALWGTFPSQSNHSAVQHATWWRQHADLRVAVAHNVESHRFISALEASRQNLTKIVWSVVANGGSEFFKAPALAQPSMQRPRACTSSFFILSSVHGDAALSRQRVHTSRGVAFPVPIHMRVVARRFGFIDSAGLRRGI